MSAEPPRRPKVFVFAWFYLPFLGGAELFIRAVSERLRHRFDFTIVTSRLDRSLPSLESQGGVTVARVGLGHRVDKLLYLGAAPWRALALGRPDLVHAVMASGGAFAAASYLKLRRRPSLLTLQDGDSEAYVRGYMGPAFPVYPRLHRSFDHIHAISSHLADRARRYHADAQRITVIPNGCDAAFFADDVAPAEREALRRRLGLEGARVIISVSRLVFTTGLDRLLRAFPAIRGRFPEAVLLLVGDGEERERLGRLAGELGVAERVRFVGAVPPSEVPRYLRLADVFVRPSLNEGLGSAFLEAMACGVPVVGSAAGGIPDFLDPGRTGLSCDPERPDTIAEAVIRVLGDPALAAALSHAGRDLVMQDYRWDTVAERLGQVYDRLLSRPRALTT